jgi:hypothetical protein
VAANSDELQLCGSNFSIDKNEVRFYVGIPAIVPLSDERMVFVFNWKLGIIEK